MELTRPDTIEAGHGLNPASENETPVTPREDPTTGEDTNSPSYLRSSPEQCLNRLELPLAGESHPVPGRQPVICHNCRLPGHKKSQCANEAPKPADATASRRRKRRNRDLATVFGPRALRFMGQGPAVQPMQIHRLELTPQLDAEGDVLNDQNRFCPHQSGSDHF